MEDKCRVFAASVSGSQIGGDPDRAAELGQRRWDQGIPAGAVSRWAGNHATSRIVRIILRPIPFLLYNMRILTRFVTCRRCGLGGQRPPCTLQLFTAIHLHAALSESGVQRRRPPDQTAGRLPHAACRCIRSASRPSRAGSAVSVLREPRNPTAHAHNWPAPAIAPLCVGLVPDGSRRRRVVFSGQSWLPRPAENRCGA